MLSLVDGCYDKPEFWKGLPTGVIALVRTAKNWVLLHFPALYPGKGRRRTYGEQAPAPKDYLAKREGWQSARSSTTGGLPG